MNHEQIFKKEIPENKSINEQQENPLQNILEEISIEGKVELPNDAEIIKEYSELFQELFGNSVELNTNPIEKLKQIAELIGTFDINRMDETVNESGVTIEKAQKWAYIPQLINEWKTLNCSGTAAMATSILREQNIEAYIANPVGHAVTFAHIPDQGWYYVDARNNIVELMENAHIETSPNSRIGIAQLQESISGYKLIPFYHSIQNAVNHMTAENHEALQEEANMGEEDALLAKKLLGDNFETGLNLPKINEKLKLNNTEAWKQEVESAGVEDDVNNGMKEFSKILGNDQVDTIINHLKSNAEDRKKLEEIFKTAPEELSQIEELRNQLNTQDELIFGVDRNLFIKAHQAFWEQTVQLRLVDPNRFAKHLESHIRHAISRP